MVNVVFVCVCGMLGMSAAFFWVWYYDLFPKTILPRQDDVLQNTSQNTLCCPFGPAWQPIVCGEICKFNITTTLVCGHRA